MCILLVEQAFKAVNSDLACSIQLASEGQNGDRRVQSDNVKSELRCRK